MLTGDIDTIVIRNLKNERLSVLVSGNEDSDTAVVFVHGFGSNKHENFKLFDDISLSLENDFATFRFDFSGYGDSEGKDEDSSLEKMKDDLYRVIRYVEFIHQRVFIVGHSLGTFVVSALRSPHISRIVFTSPPNPDMNLFIRNIQARIIDKGGKVNEKGITGYVRSNGLVQKIGPNFWKDLQSFDPKSSTEMLTLNSSVIIFDPQDDEVVKDRNFDHLVDYQEKGIQSKSLPGDHNFSKSEDRKRLIEEINIFFRT